MIYLASPYSHHEPSVRDMRYLKARDAAMTIAMSGHLVYSPIVHWHDAGIAHGIGCGWSIWKEQDEGMLKLASRVWVLMLEGWDRSKGVAGETALAERLMLPVLYISPQQVEGLKVKKCSPFS